MNKCRSVATGCVLLALSVAPLPCFAQAARSGKTFNIGGSTLIRFPDVAHDTINDGYLVVNGTGFIEGQLLNAAGVKVGGFTVNASRGLPGQDAQCPRVVFSADLNGGAGGYLVTWHETFGGAFSQVRGRMFSTAGTPLTGDLVLTPEIGALAKGLTSNWGMGAAIAYSTTSREFLVTWMGGYTTTNDVKFTRLGLAGNLLQASATITAGSIDWERDPAVAYDAATDEFLIAYAGYWNAQRYGYISTQRVKAGSGTVIGAATELIRSAATAIPTVSYNTATAQYLITWYNASTSSAAMYGVSVRGSDGVPTGPVRVMSAKYISYDALDVKYNAKSGDFLLVTYGAAPQAWEDAAVSIKSDGTPYDNGFIVTNTPDVRPVRSGSDGNYSPRLIDDSSTGRWLMVTDSVFTAVYGQFVASQNTSGPGTVPTSNPPPTSSAPLLSIDVPSANAQVSTNGFFVSGWALDKGASVSSGSGIDFVHVYAWPTGGGSAIFLGAAMLGAPQRPDVAAYYGAQFVNSGFSLTTGPLPPGTYDIAVYAHNTLGNTIDGRLVRVTAVAPFSMPRMWVDSPAANQTTSQHLTISGWALDLGSPSNAGVDAIHVYAYPAAGGAPLFVGAATYGTVRGDVGAAFGSSRFNASGFQLNATLAAGDYTLVVFARSAVTGTFNNAQSVPIKVR